MKRYLALMMLLFMIMMGSMTANAQHYISGMEGTDTAVLKDGFTVRSYNVFYTADEFKDNDGNSVGDIDLNQFASFLRAYYMTDLEFLGAKYGLGLGLPVGYVDLKVNGMSDDNFNLGDLLIEPVILKWNYDKFDAFASVGVFAPTGQFENDEPLNIGGGHWTIMPSVGGIFYFDDAKTWSMGATARYEFNTEVEDTDFRHGDVFTTEYGLTKAFPICGKDALTVGVNGYTRVQTTDSDINDVDIKDAREFVTAIGPAIGYHVDALNLDIGAKAFFELAAENQTEGAKYMLNVSYSF